MTSFFYFFALLTFGYIAIGAFGAAAFIWLWQLATGSDRENVVAVAVEAVGELKHHSCCLISLLGMWTVTFCVALSHPGPGLLEAQNWGGTVTPAFQAYITQKFNSLMYGKNAAPALPTIFAPPTGSWFWWEASVGYALLILAYILFVCAEEFGVAWDKAMKVVEKHRTRHEAATAAARIAPRPAPMPQNPPAATATATTGSSSSGKAPTGTAPVTVTATATASPAPQPKSRLLGFFTMDMVAEVAWTLVREFIGEIRRRRVV